MIQFNKPTNLNGTELLNELSAKGIVAKDRPFIDDNGNFWLDIKESDKDKAAAIVAAHNGTTVAPDNTATRAALLVKLGITADEAALLLS